MVNKSNETQQQPVELKFLVTTFCNLYQVRELKLIQEKQNEDCCTQEKNADIK